MAVRFQERERKLPDPWHEAEKLGKKSHLKTFPRSLFFPKTLWFGEINQIELFPRHRKKATASNSNVHHGQRMTKHTSHIIEHSSASRKPWHAFSKMLFAWPPRLCNKDSDKPATILESSQMMKYHKFQLAFYIISKFLIYRCDHISEKTRCRRHWYSLNNV